MEFEADTVEDDDRFIVRLTAWEGPIEALLDLARSQKIDLAAINILELIDQFQAIMSRAIHLRIELAADWLVMATWLTYLKSRLLLKRPKERKDEVQDDDALALHLKRLNMVKSATERHADRLTLGRDLFAPAKRNNDVTVGNRLGVSFHAFLAAYPKDIVVNDHVAVPDLEPFDLDTVEGAIARLTSDMPEEWTNLLDLVPFAEGLRLTSNIATTLIGALELTRDHQSELSQDGLFDVIRVRRRREDRG